MKIWYVSSRNFKKFNSNPQGELKFDVIDRKTHRTFGRVTIDITAQAGTDPNTTFHGYQRKKCAIMSTGTATKHIGTVSIAQTTRQESYRTVGNLYISLETRWRTQSLAWIQDQKAKSAPAEIPSSTFDQNTDVLSSFELKEVRSTVLDERMFVSLKSRLWRRMILMILCRQ